MKSSSDIATKFKSENSPEPFAEISALLPSLPSVIRYYDDFNNSFQSIRNPAEEDLYVVTVWGKKKKIRFANLDISLKLIYKHLFNYLLGNNISVGTVTNYFQSGVRIFENDVLAIVMASPTNIHEIWSGLRSRDVDAASLSFLKWLLKFFCAYRINSWSPVYVDFLSTTLPLPFRDKYVSIRSGNSFISPEQEIGIIQHLDAVVRNIKEHRTISLADLADAGMLLCSYQFGMRAVQICMLSKKRMRIWDDEVTGEKHVHLNFHYGKQSGSSTSLKNLILVSRKVRHEWSTIFVELRSAVLKIDDDSDPKLFRAKSSVEIASRIKSMGYGTTTRLRHSAAQRLVDAGATHEELAEFLGHAQTNTGNIYFAVAASHAERVNQALGASDLYQTVRKIAYDRYISPEELALLKEDQQVAGVPHGIPISGIGGCKSGQPMCSFNPVLSCYGCFKFLPIKKIEIHQSVLRDMQEVVLQFEKSGREHNGAAPFGQLRTTIEQIKSTIFDLERDEH